MTDTFTDQRMRSIQECLLNDFNTLLIVMNEYIVESSLFENQYEINNSLLNPETHLQAHLSILAVCFCKHLDSIDLSNLCSSDD